MRRFAIDASVVLKSILKEDDKVKVRFEELLTKAKNKDVEILSHPLLILEVSNGFRFSIKDKNLSLELFDIFTKLPIKIVNLTRIQQEKILSLSYDLDTSVYDTSYHVLAKLYAATFLTSDEDYFKKAKILGDIEFVG